MAARHPEPKRAGSTSCIAPVLVQFHKLREVLLSLVEREHNAAEAVGMKIIWFVAMIASALLTALFCLYKRFSLLGYTFWVGDFDNTFTGKGLFQQLRLLSTNTISFSQQSHEYMPEVTARWLVSRPQ